MTHWIAGEDDKGHPAWLEYVSYSQWGLVLRSIRIRWLALEMSGAWINKHRGIVNYDIQC
jgi:hypothetical protein